MTVREILFFICLAFEVLLTSCGNGKTTDASNLTEAQAARQAGLEYLDHNKLPEAEHEFRKLIELAPQEIIGYANLGLVYLRQGNLPEAEKHLHRALDLDPQNVTVRLNLFEVFQQLDQPDKAEEQLLKILEQDPDNLFVLYKMSEQSQAGADGSMTELNEYLQKIIELAPANIVPRVYFLEYLLENGHHGKALEQFEDIRSKFERLPEGTQDLFDQAYDHLLKSRTAEAYQALLMFHNQLKLTEWYQADVRSLRGSEFSQIGIPVISFSRKMVGYGGEDDNLVYQNISFNDVADNAGLTLDNPTGSNSQDFHSYIKVGDLDNDGGQDLFIGVNGRNGQGLFMYSNELGRFDEVIESAGIEDLGNSRHASLADYDNDGFLDLFLICDGFVRLYHNIDVLKYEDVTASGGLGEIADGIVSLFFDADHDGDLDLYVGTNGSDRLYQNNRDGSFTDISESAGIGGAASPTPDIALGDFDDDGDIDFLVANTSGNRLFYNSRMGRFEDVTASSGLDISDASNQVSPGDFNNDGFLDLFITDSTGNFKLYQGQGKNGFTEVTELIKELEHANSIKPRAHEFFDYDNDGFLDLVIAGEGVDDSNSHMILMRNSRHSFENVSWTLPESLNPISSLAIGDYNEDGDLDIFTTFKNGNIGLLRNDGGNMNYQLKIQLVGLREGSGKNNYFGIGSKVEVRAGPLYQMRTITSPTEYFGLGPNERADILRVRWTNGVPQNIFSPHSDLDLIEEQKLKGSCPFLYTWNGTKYVFVKDMMWRSALGMPLGIMTSDDSRTYAFPEASREYLKIPGSMLSIENQRFNIKITGELWETIYLDQLMLYAVDHPIASDFLLDEKFVPPPFPELKLYPIEERYYPVSVSDGQSDLFEKVAKKDHHYISNLSRSRYQGITELKDLIIDLGKDTTTDNLHLVLNGWIFPSDASINVAVSQSNQVAMVPPYLQVLDEAGQWVTVIENLGFPLGKNKTMITDLSEVFLTSERKIRIRTSMQIYWDHIFYTYIDKPFEGRATRVPIGEASLSYRGFSVEFRKGGNYGPHWFDYYNTTTDPQWMDLEGEYTRYGDVKDLLASDDNQYIIYNAGDEVSIGFASDDLPDIPAGWTRDFVIYSVGWVKDGDLNTAYGQTVTPLPFHGMSSYPYPENEAYPYAENSAYYDKYNTRTVDNARFRGWLKETD